MGSARRASPLRPPGFRAGAGSPSRSPALCRQPRYRPGSRLASRLSEKGEPGTVAWAVECLCILVERHGAAEVRAVDRENADLALVLDHESAKGELARRVVASAVGHDERRVGVAGRIELDRVAVL